MSCRFRWWPSGADSSRLRVREKSKCTRLANVENKHNPRTKKEWRWLNVLSQPCTSFVETEWRRNKENTEVEWRSKALWRYHILVVPCLSDSLFTRLISPWFHNKEVEMNIFIDKHCFFFIFDNARDWFNLVVFSDISTLVGYLMPNPVCIYIYIYICILFGPVKPKSVIIPSGQKSFNYEHLNFPGKELNVTDITEQ